MEAEAVLKREAKDCVTLVPAESKEPDVAEEASAKSAAALTMRQNCDSSPFDPQEPEKSRRLPNNSRPDLAAVQRSAKLAQDKGEKPAGRRLE